MQRCTHVLSFLPFDLLLLYHSIAPLIKQDLTVAVAHPHYCAATLPATAQPAFVRRLVALWKQLTTPEERWVLAGCQLLLYALHMLQLYCTAVLLLSTRKAPAIFLSNQHRSIKWQYAPRPAGLPAGGLCSWKGACACRASGAALCWSWPGRRWGTLQVRSWVLSYCIGLGSLCLFAGSLQQLPSACSALHQPVGVPALVPAYHHHPLTPPPPPPPPPPPLQPCGPCTSRP